MAATEGQPSHLHSTNGRREDGRLTPPAYIPLARTQISKPIPAAGEARKCAFYSRETCELLKIGVLCSSGKKGGRLVVRSSRAQPRQAGRRRRTSRQRSSTFALGGSQVTGKQGTLLCLSVPVGPGPVSSAPYLALLGGSADPCRLSQAPAWRASSQGQPVVGSAGRLGWWAGGARHLSLWVWPVAAAPMLPALVPVPSGSPGCAPPRPPAMSLQLGAGSGHPLVPIMSTSSPRHSGHQDYRSPLFLCGTLLGTGMNMPCAEMGLVQRWPVEPLGTQNLETQEKTHVCPLLSENCSPRNMLQGSDCAGTENTCVRQFDAVLFVTAEARPGHALESSTRQRPESKCSAVQ